ncbi:hypothetical protein O181_021540 [Austropuccinia psidii MF-1]|uniref:Uncharacterized protein n=1 Tax=Austropuccinia psidii MF-1 TaxID=1389203 RepID=A0A9Q3GX74_9BASI|nr:hypothetical protein [Austropuccinia psidii MF-1]
MRNVLDIFKAAKDWKDSKTLIEQNEVRKKTGVRWSELNSLPYRNPNMHLALGILHNWLDISGFNGAFKMKCKRKKGVKRRDQKEEEAMLEQQQRR